MAPIIDHVKHAARVIDVLLRPVNGLFPRMATMFWDEKTVIRATRRTYKGKIRQQAYSPIEIVLHIGRPNYAERIYIKKCKKDGEKFPLNFIRKKFGPKLNKAKVAA